MARIIRISFEKPHLIKNAAQPQNQEMSEYKIRITLQEKNLISDYCLKYPRENNAAIGRLFTERLGKLVNRFLVLRVRQNIHAAQLVPDGTYINYRTSVTGFERDLYNSILKTLTKTPLTYPQIVIIAHQVQKKYPNNAAVQAMQFSTRWWKRFKSNLSIFPDILSKRVS